MKPFQVLCINKGPWKADESAKRNIKPVYLGVYLVVEERYTSGYQKKDGIIPPGYWFRLAECGGWFHSSFFIKLPEQDADAMQEAERECIVNLEKAVV